MSYEEFIAAKSKVVDADPVPHGKLSTKLFPHQRDLVSWALRRGRAAIFADTGLGKTLIELEWAKHCAKNGRVLILAPLAVAEQTVREGKQFGIKAAYARDDEAKHKITVTNYEMLHAFDPSSFVAVVLDESSILKAQDGKTRTRIIEAFAATRWRLAATATPAPNDFTELGNHSQFLGVKSHLEMLSEYFCHDGGETQTWRLKGHHDGFAICEQDINPSETLQHRSAREDKDERHICPLQLEVIRRCIRLWSNPNDVVWSPFAGIGSEGFVALQEGRRFIGAELKASYYRQAVRNLESAARPAQADLFAGVG